MSAAEALLRGLEEEAVDKIVQAGGRRSTCEVRRHGHISQPTSADHGAAIELRCSSQAVVWVYAWAGDLP